jgi:hypothetical protein
MRLIPSERKNKCHCHFFFNSLKLKHHIQQKLLINKLQIDTHSVGNKKHAWKNNKLFISQNNSITFNSHYYSLCQNLTNFLYHSHETVNTSTRQNFCRTPGPRDHAQINVLSKNHFTKRSLPLLPLI